METTDTSRLKQTLTLTGAMNVVKGSTNQQDDTNTFFTVSVSPECMCKYSYVTMVTWPNMVVMCLSTKSLAEGLFTILNRWKTICQSGRAYNDKGRAADCGVLWERQVVPIQDYHSKVRRWGQFVKRGCPYDSWCGKERRR